ncbi:MAG: glycosyltransferase family 2 protein [Candidatus Omnitrophota bacterium]|jgi:glycosyltransferase involved in cell wall biosynthesis
MLSVIIPAYNEEKAIEAIVNKVSSLPIEKEIIVVNDCSKDRTAAILSSFSLSNLKVIHHASKRGRAAAARTGLENAIGEFIIIQDVDLEYDPNGHLKLLEAIKNSNFDLALGSRSTRMSFRDIALSILFGIKLKDWSSRCQLMRRESLLRLLPELKGVNITFDILTKAIRKKMRVIEVPV